MLIRPSRRDILHYATAGAAATLAPGALAAPADPWDRAADIARTVRAPSFPARDFQVVSFGAKGDGTTLNTAAMLQQLLHATPLAGAVSSSRLGVS